MPTKLEEIMARTKARVDERKAQATLPELERRAQAHTPRGFAAHLRDVSATRPAIIAECKRASPSKGLLRAVYEAAEIAGEYERAGAAAISVLTEPEFFQGSLDHLSDVSAAVSLPVLRKDFMLDEFQVLEARAAGADAILLIVAALSDAQLRQMAGTARDTGLDILCEVHNREELSRAVSLDVDAMGVNCRDLKTLAVDLGVHEELAPLLPDRTMRVAESGIRTAADLGRLRALGYGAFLVGEALMRQASPGRALLELTGG